MEWTGWIIKNRGNILFSNHFRPMQDILEYYSKKSGQAFSSVRWLPGFITNIRTAMALMDLIKIDRVATIRYTYYLYGLVTVRRIPNAVFITSFKKSLLLKHEAHKMRIPSFGLVDTDSSGFV